MSLRELPPGQANNLDKWRHVRYVPLVILLILAIAAAGAGIWYQRTASTEVAVPTPTASSSSRLPEQCAPAVDVPTATPWYGTAAAASEQVWNSHASDLSNAYVLGEDSWVFWGDIQANNFSQAIGRRFLAVDELTRWHDWMKDLDTRLTEAGIQLYIVVAPAKWAVYSDELPAWSQDVRGPGSLDQLMAAGTDLPLVDLRAPLQQEAANNPTYSRVNSHWSDYGSYVGWNALAECITANQPDVALSPIPLSGVAVSDEFNEFANYGLTSPVPDWTTPEFTEPLLPVTLTASGEEPKVVDGFTRTGLELLPAETSTPGAQSDDSVLFVRDSFGTSMSVYLQQAFAQTMQVRHNIDAGPGTQPDILTLANVYQPDIVILEIAQRHLNFPPQ